MGSNPIEVPKYRIVIQYYLAMFTPMGESPLKLFFIIIIIIIIIISAFFSSKSSQDFIPAIKKWRNKVS